MHEAGHHHHFLGLLVLEGTQRGIAPVLAGYHVVVAEIGKVVLVLAVFDVYAKRMRNAAKLVATVMGVSRALHRYLAFILVLQGCSSSGRVGFRYPVKGARIELVLGGASYFYHATVINQVGFGVGRKGGLSNVLFDFRSLLGMCNGGCE